MCEECETLAKEKVREEKTGCSCGCLANETQILNGDRVRRPKSNEKREDHDPTPIPPLIEFEP